METTYQIRFSERKLEGYFAEEEEHDFFIGYSKPKGEIKEKRCNLKCSSVLPYYMVRSQECGSEHTTITDFDRKPSIYRKLP